ncbi:hypothetical protein TVAG_228610 [Trichomonas vaginalis G3]|uniref:Uncharacterized protein n=2 Tax=Trichomonas vaginalis (strain ATCC PRA-98 / G3) TaxID=412133 RepID=A2DJ23_TRIV3|nr:hypothetical protein TVAGG3_0470730 [Trichomonas vaginalis G3]EAY19598.1 hypothetical protein TVAG_228610 [Trichomonas vaginalis G3]KAI5515039.1 hypothetical protein TVAGG3_0470730 [Trichomonas vaginalis G3]|eukprot:XP_001580584.1 hypothetical protein [Trichomonas vaginalis G3]
MRRCCCKCGCLCVNGREADPEELPEQLRTKRDDKQDAFVIRSNSIEIKDENCLEVTPETSQKVTIVCMKCGQYITLFEKMGYGFAVLNRNQYRPSRRQSYTNTNQDSKMISNPLIQKYVNFDSQKDNDDPLFSYDSYASDTVLSEEDDINFIDDGDFEYMFSGTTDPFVGSFTDRFMDSPVKDLLLTLV